MMLAISCKDTCHADLDLQKQAIEITSAHNARQLGGYCIDGKHIRKDVLLRTARLSSLTEKDSLILAEKYKVQCIYDFRGAEEIQASPDIIPGNSRYLPLSLSFGTATAAHSGAGSEREMIGMLLKYADNPMIQDMCENMYNKIFFEKSSQEVYRKFFADLITINPENGAVLWHCTQGKDRAGSASAMLLSALGADRELIMADYTLSKVYYDPAIEGIPVSNEIQRNVLNTLISANPVIFERTLDRIDAEYGSLRNYLTECLGVTPEMMNILRERYLE